MTFIFWHHEAAGIELLGMLNGTTEVFAAMQSASICMVNCNWRGSLEMFCRSAVEAQVAGVPVIGTARGSIPEVVSDGESGVLVRRPGIDALASAVADLLLDRPRQRHMRERGPAWARRFADYNALAEEWELIAVRTLRGEPAPVQRRAPEDVLRWAFYGSARARVREIVRGTRLERILLRLIS